jgi:hypothetical protein
MFILLGVSFKRSSYPNFFLTNSHTLIDNWKKSRKGYKHSPETIAKIKEKRALQKNVRGVIQYDK